MARLGPWLGSTWAVRGRAGVAWRRRSYRRRGHAVLAPERAEVELPAREQRARLVHRLDIEVGLPHAPGALLLEERLHPAAAAAAARDAVEVAAPLGREACVEEAWA